MTLGMIDEAGKTNEARKGGKEGVGTGRGVRG